jgi:NTE family protein
VGNTRDVDSDTTAIVLGGGGALGWIYNAGVLSAIREFGVDLDAIPLMVGTSAGSAVAASARAGTDPDEIIEAMSRGPSAEQRERIQAEVREVRKSLKPMSPSLIRQSLRARAHPLMALAGLVPRGWFPTAFVHRFPGIPDLADWPDGLWIPAVRATDGKVVVFGRDRSDIHVADAVAASSAVPGMFQPKHIDGEDYIDGGVVSPTHAHLADHGVAEAVIISSPMTRPSRRFTARHARKRLAAEMDELNAAGVRVLLVEPTRELVDIAEGFPRRNPAAAPAIADRARADVTEAIERAGF